MVSAETILRCSARNLEKEDIRADGLSLNLLPSHHASSASVDAKEQAHFYLSYPIAMISYVTPVDALSDLYPSTPLIEFPPYKILAY